MIYGVLLCGIDGEGLKVDVFWFVLCVILLSGRVLAFALEYLFGKIALDIFLCRIYYKHLLNKNKCVQEKFKA